MKKYFNFIVITLILPLLVSCQTAKKKEVIYKPPEDIIKTSEIIAQGKKDIEKKIIEGPNPILAPKPLESKRKTLTTTEGNSYVSIPDKYTNLKQNISINFQGLDFKYVMSLMAELAQINILVGDEVSGTVNAKINNVPWDIAFQTLLDMKTLGSDINAENGIIRIHSPEKLQGQEAFKKERAQVLQDKLALEESVEPTMAQLFKLYYLEPAQAKATLDDLFGLGEQAAAEGASSNIASSLAITVEDTTRSIIVKGIKKDLDLVDSVIKEIDIRTKQVLIEAFVVEADKNFQKALGSKISAMQQGRPQDTSQQQYTISGLQGSAATTPSSITLGGAAGTISNTGITNATSGIGIIKSFTSAALAVEIQALEATGSTTIVSSPSVFTLNNQEAEIVQGTEIPYQTVEDGEVTTQFKEAALSLTVTPSIIGDGNVLLDIEVSNDSPDTSLGTDEPAIKTNSITTKLLITDGDIVVIGGIKIDTDTRDSTATPGLSKVPVVGNLFKGKTTSDQRDEMLIFIAPKVVN